MSTSVKIEEKFNSEGKRICNVTNCYNPHKGKGFCNTHYWQVKRTGSIKTKKTVSNLKGEVWEDVVDFEGLYKISNKGRLKSVDRYIKTVNGQKRFVLGDLMKPHCDRYELATLCKDFKNHCIGVHILVAKAFLPNQKNKSYVNHKDFNTFNNNVSNLEWVTPRENVWHYVKSQDYTSKYVGVFKCHYGNKWRAAIKINGVKKNLGLYESEKEASIAVKRELGII